MSPNGLPEQWNWRKCPFRVIRTVSGEDHSACGGEWVVCEAGGGIVLGESDADSTDAVCRSCDIPPSLKKRQSCLFVVPFRVFRQNGIQSYYSCRWHLNIPSRNVPKNNDWCRGCLHWFPRPDEALVPNTFDFSRRALELFLSGLSAGPPLDKKKFLSKNQRMQSNDN